ncbi:TrmB family transcriptional regulator [Haloarcula nitratireducens]|uniref:TrmB family transcriptional regulator n=1 Tax=Haloarcula nitratireducens TaxID=2487749 RepID=A0AAW4PJS6_9EURY|nr:helix-turn-helix domain-containing protein [Halomicroarcula nitratireducens]MBX0298223.1 TrmB family transcriptional regulator [Halomicroarcula nitratireducens]
MDDVSNQGQAIELLQQLGLKEYEAKAFVALTRRQRGTAKDISETSEVPRTRIYDAIRVLESKGLVETQHSNPQVFRAVSIDEAVNTLQSEYVKRTESLRSVLSELEPADAEESTEVTHEVWSISGDQGITSRTRQLIEGATKEVILVVGHESVFTDQLVEQLRSAQERDVHVIIGTIDEELQAAIQDALPDVEVFVSGLDWLSRSPLPGDDTEISRLLLVDREAILVSSFTDTRADGREHEQAVFGRGFDNGLVAITRRLMATGLRSGNDPETGEI